LPDHQVILVGSGQLVKSRSGFGIKNKADYLRVNSGQFYFLKLKT